VTGDRKHVGQYQLFGLVFGNVYLNAGHYLSGPYQAVPDRTRPYQTSFIFLTRFL
jgi:hypothetical protein